MHGKVCAGSFLNRLMSNAETPVVPQLVRAGDQHIYLAQGALKYLVRHSFRESIFEFKDPYPDEMSDLGTTLVELIETAVSVGWFRSATASEIVTRWARVPDLKIALSSKNLLTNGKRAELLSMVLSQCSDWVSNFASSKPAYLPTVIGQIELQATRPIFEGHTKQKHQKAMREYFDRDINIARKEPYIIGIKIWARTDLHWAQNPCPLASRFVGVHLPDEVPELYPDDCPDEDACCCVLREMVFVTDETTEKRLLEQRLRDRKTDSI